MSMLGNKKLFFGLTLLLSSAVSAEEMMVTISESAQKAINTNPEVQARWHDFRATSEQQEVARGGFLPQVDLTAGIGRERQNFHDNQGPNVKYSHRSARITLNQMVYDGFATRREVDRLGFSSRAKYYQLLDAAEQFSLEAYRAHEDVLRFRELLRLAQENLDKHRDVFKLITKRVKAGVGRSVDLEQVTGRMALAESNVLTETSNLHDVSARYQRITGEFPAKMMAPANVGQMPIPATLDDGIYRAFATNPAHLAAIENIRASTEEVEGRRSALQPRLDFRASADYGDDYNQINGKSSNYLAEFVMSYNLYRGGSDVAAIRQFSERLSLAEDLRDKSCRDIRQTLAIAYNDVQRISEQLRFLEQHQLSIAKAREAYRNQFDIGQRTLLDLLDTENEYFEASRAYLNGKYDYSIAQARTMASMGELMTTLQISRTGMPGIPSMDHTGEAATGATPAACRL